MATFLLPRKSRIGNKKVTKKLKLDKYLIDWESDSKSKFQKRVKDFLFPYWKNHLVYEECKVAGTRLTFDIYNHTLAIVIECQGRQHETHVEFFHGKGVAGRLQFLEQLKRDSYKIDFCDLNDILFVEIYEKDKLTKDLFGRQGVIL